jgi:hypothetical protein
MAGWHAPRRTTPGGQARYSDLAVELVLTLRLVFHLALRPAEGFTASVLRLLGQALRVPDHTTVSRRSRGCAGRRPETVPHGPMHLVIDSTGLKLFGRGEWDAEKHGRARRSWRSLYGAFRVKGSSPPLRLERHLGRAWLIPRSGGWPEGSSPWRRWSSRRELVCGGSHDPNHDAAMRIGGEAPGRRAHSAPRLGGHTCARVTATSDRHR